MKRRDGWRVLAALSAFQIAGVAHAGPVEQLVEVAMHTTDAKVMAVRYLNGGDGILFTRDGGDTWKLLCNAALLDPAQPHGESIKIGIAADGTTLMGTFSGLWHDDTRACNWEPESKYDGEWIADFTLDPLDPNITYSVTSTGGGRPNGIIRRDANGAWSDFGTKDVLLITGVFVVKHGSGKRFYVSGVKFYPTMDDAGSAPSIYVTRVSDDDGATWTEYVYGPAPGTFHMQGVDPTNPDRILASINIVEDLGLPRDQMNDSVIVSSDGGKTWTPYLTLTEIGGVAFAPDGRVFIGDLGGIGGEPMPPRGLWMAPNLDTAPTKLPNSDYPVQCLGYQAATDTLYACQHFWFGTVDTMDGTFTTKMNLADVPSMVACDGVDMAATCMTQLCGAYCGIGHFAQAPVCTAYDTPICGPLAADNFKAAGSGGTGTAGMKAPHVKNPTHGCCAVAPGAHRPGTWPVGVVAALAAVLAHRRRRRLC